MTARVTPYLSFAGNTREAMEFYQSIFGGKLDITTYADLHRTQNPAEEGLVAHSMLVGATGVTLMGSDSPTLEQHRAGGAVSVALGGDETELTQHWGRLTEDGTVTVPFARSAWGALYGQCTDQFGIAWLLNATTSGEPQ